MTVDDVVWKDFCKRLSAAMRGVLEHRVTPEEVSLIIDDEQTLTDPDVKGHLQYIIWESGGSPDLYRDMVELLEAGMSEAELARYYNTKQEGPISRLKRTWRQIFGRS